MPVLTGVDVLGIQRYVFGSNRLRDVLAASWMVGEVTSSERLKQWADLGPSSVLLAAGGSAVIEFDAIGKARNWAARYSRWLHETAPGLEAVVVHRPYDGGALAWALRALQVDLARAKSERVPSVPQLGLSVTATCSITGLPATDADQEDIVSPGVHQLRSHLGQARRKWTDFVTSLAHPPGWNVDFPSEIDHMGRTHGQSSLVGVVHVDGNDVGSLIKRWLDHCIDEGTDDDTVRAHYLEWSSDIDEAGRAAFTAAVKRTAACIEVEGDHCVLRGTPFELGYRLHDGRSDPVHHRAQHTVFLPLHPVLLGGDDLTFLCDGRIAVDLAVEALRVVGDRTIRHLGSNGETLTGCAGVAVVKAHAPFHRSYELAEDLCRSAKRARMNAHTDGGAETGSWLDWHVGTTRPGETVEQIRKRAYSRGDRTLTMRPYPLAETAREQSWNWLDEQVLGPGPNLQAQGFRGVDYWAGSRSRVKTLGTLVVDGPDAVRHQVKAWKAMESSVELPGDLDDGGHVGASTPLLDAVELVDLHLRLEPDGRRNASAAGQAGTGGQRAS